MAIWVIDHDPSAMAAVLSSASAESSVRDGLRGFPEPPRAARRHSPQGVLLGKVRACCDQRDGNLDDAVLAGEIELEIGEGGRGVLGVIEPPRSRRVMAGDRLGVRDPHDKERMPAVGAARACTQGVPVSCTYRLRTVLVSRKKAATVSDARG